MGAQSQLGREGPPGPRAPRQVTSKLDGCRGHPGGRCVPWPKNKARPTIRPAWRTFLMGGVEPDVVVPGVVKGLIPEGGRLLVELDADSAHLALADVAAGPGPPSGAATLRVLTSGRKSI